MAVPQPEHRVNVRVINELAWHNLFIRTMLVRPAYAELRRLSRPNSRSSTCRASAPIPPATAAAPRR
jgi:ATP-dependent phosphoenolpyruvate carboxykinase